jgi:hypothetical protein
MKRIKHLTLLLLLLLTAGTTTAQIEQPRRILEIGATGGLNMSKLDVQPQIRQTYLNGINSGLFVRYTSEKYFSMICATQIEINFAQRGWEEDFDNGTDNSYRRVMNYVEIPLFAHLSWGKEERGMQFFLNLGPQIGFLMNETEKYTGDWLIDERPVNIRPIYGKATKNEFDYGIAGGLGLELKTKIGNFFIEGRYYYGLADIFSNSKMDDFGRSANTTITARLGYSIRIF